MKKLFILTFTTLFLSSCAYVTVKEQNQKEETPEKYSEAEGEDEARIYIRNLAAMNYLDQASVIKDTAYIGYPSRRGVAHSQDNLAQTFLHDMQKGNFKNIICCKVINTSIDHIWNDSIISGDMVGYAEIQK